MPTVLSEVTVPRTFSTCTVLLTLSVVGSPQPTARRIDFANLTYPWSRTWDRGLAAVSNWRWLDERATGLLRLHDGNHDFGEGSGYLMVSSVAYGGLDGDGRDEAAVDLIRGSGGTANWHYLYVFGNRNGVARPLGILRSGSRADGGLTAVAIRNHVLVLEFNDSKLRTADCCSDGFIRVRAELHSGFNRRAGMVHPARSLTPATGDERARMLCQHRARSGTSNGSALAAERHDVTPLTE